MTEGVSIALVFGKGGHGGGWCGRSTRRRPTDFVFPTLEAPRDERPCPLAVTRGGLACC